MANAPHSRVAAPPGPGPLGSLGETKRRHGLGGAERRSRREADSTAFGRSASALRPRLCPSEPCPTSSWRIARFFRQRLKILGWVPRCRKFRERGLQVRRSPKAAPRGSLAPGLILCAQRDSAVVHYSLQGLPNERTLVAELETRRASKASSGSSGKNLD